MFFQLLLTILFTKYIYAGPVHISENTITTSLKYIQGSLQDGITVGQGVFWSLFFDQNFITDDLSVQGSAAFYLTATNLPGQDQPGDFKIESLVNSNIVAISFPSDNTGGDLTFSGETMQNNGNLFVSNAAEVNFKADDFINYGNISIQGEYVEKQQTLGILDQSLLYNYGQICLTDVSYQMDQQLYGMGCIQLFERSIFTIIAENEKYVFDNTIVMNDPNVLIAFTPTGSYFTVSGFGGGNGITFTGGDFTVTFDYKEKEGILSINTHESGYVDYFNIGRGYNGALFEQKTVGVVTYNGEVPNLVPSKCRACPSFPIAPSPNP